MNKDKERAKSVKGGNVKVKIKVNGVNTKKQPQQKEQQIQPFKANALSQQQPLTTYQPSYNYLSQSYTFRNDNTLLDTVSPCYHCHNHIHCKHHHYHCKYH
jgi:hypothetical protein